MSMTLAPRRRAIFNRRGRFARDCRRLGFGAALIVAIGLVFTMGIKIGAHTTADSPVKSIIAAYLN